MEPLSPELLKAIKTCFLRLDKELLQNGAYYEFGIYQGASLCWAVGVAEPLVGPEFMFYGFDSFQGLPKSRVDSEYNWFEGNYKASLGEVEENIRESGADRKRIVLTPGFFSRHIFSEFWEKHGKTPALLVIDSDIYESAKEVLEFFGPKLVKGSIVILDDWDAAKTGGEQRAWREFKKKYPDFREEKIFTYPSDGIVFEVVAASGAH